jgi:hypothetical protein|nr:MAG TPA: hypothetical protein [Caudoviricetes sp.]
MLINKLMRLIGRLDRYLRLQEDESSMFRKEPYRYSNAHTKGRLKYVQTITTGPAKYAGQKTTKTIIHTKN